MSTPFDLRQCSTAITWVRSPAVVAVEPGPEPFADGLLNACYNALDRHVVHGRADQPAVVCQRPAGLGIAETTLSYADLLDRVGRFGGVLRACGVVQGDVVLVALPAIPEAVVALLACARIGAVHAVVPTTLSTPALRDWLQQWKPAVVVLGADSPALATALGEPDTHQPAVCVVLDGTEADAGLGERLIDWSAAMREGAVPPAECVPLPAEHPLYVGLQPRLHPTSSVAGLAWAGQHRGTVRPGQRWTPDPSVDWVRGHVWQVYAPLIVGATAVLRDAATGAPLVERPQWLALVEDGLLALTSSGTH